MNITEKELAQALVGVARAQVAMLSALSSADRVHALEKLQGALSAITGAGKPTAKPLTWETFPSHLLLHATASPGPNRPSLSELARQASERLSQNPAGT